MALRHAEVQAKLNRVHKRTYPTRISSASLEFLTVGGTLKTVDVAITSGISIVTGGNGAGKTTLLRGLSTLGGETTSEWPEHLASVSVRGFHLDHAWATTATKGGNDELQITVDEGSPPGVTFIDPFHQSQEIQRQIAADPNARDLIEGSDPYAFEKDWLAHASRVLQRKYDSIETVEFESFAEEIAAPWVSVTCEGFTYDLRSMGRGEFSALYLLWRLAQVESNSIVIIDEPEAGLAAFSQARLKETLAYLSMEKGIQFIITTHAPDMYLGLGGEPVTVLETFPLPRSHPPVSAREAAHVLQLPRVSTTVCVFTEDAVAAALLRSIIKAENPLLSDSIEVHYSKNGESALEKVDDEFVDGKTPGKFIRLLTVFDGDQRQFADGRRLDSDTRAYLPGDLAPEETLASLVRKLVPEMGDAELEPIVGSVFNFRNVLSRESGSDHHDWFVAVSRLFTNYDSTCDALLEICAKNVDYQRDARDLVVRLEKTLGC